MSGGTLAPAVFAALLPALAPAASGASTLQLTSDPLSIWVRIRLSPSELAIAPSLERVREGRADRSDERRLELALLGLTRGILPRDPRAVVLLLHLARRLAAGPAVWTLPPEVAKKNLESALRLPLRGELRSLAHYELALLALGRTIGSAPSGIEAPESEMDLGRHLSELIWGALDDEWSANGLLLQGMIAWERGRLFTARKDFDAAFTLRLENRKKAEVALLMALVETERGDESSAVRWFDGALALRKGTTEVSELLFGAELPWEPELRRYLGAWPNWRRLAATDSLAETNEAPGHGLYVSPFFRAATRLQRILEKRGGPEPSESLGSPSP